MSGLSSAGFTIPTVDEIATQLAQLVHDRIDVRIDTGPYSVVGQLIGIWAERLHEVWLGERDVYQAFSPGGASGQALTNLALITGTLRLASTFSRVVGSVTLNAGVTLPAGSQARVPGTDAPFETLADATNGGGSPAVISVTFQAVDSGPVHANAATLTEIVTPVSGWTAVTNATDASIGNATETDTALRVRREAELRVQGSGAIDAIIADVLDVSGVIDVQGTDNAGAATFAIVVWDGSPPAGDDDAIAQAIWDSKPAGVLSLGGTTGSATDARGVSRSVNFARATQRLVYLSLDVSIDALTYPADGDAQIQAALVTYALAHWKVGEDVIASALYAPIFSVSGVTRLNSLTLGFSASPVGTTDLVIAASEIALADTGRIVVTS